MAEKKSGTGLLAVDPEAQKLIRDCTAPYVNEMVEILVKIARTAGPRDSFKAAVKLIDYHARGGSQSDMNADGTPAAQIVVIAGSGTREMDDAADELRRLSAATFGRPQ